ncbi:hypothetical protein SOM61_22575 [Massilia sp. CFBP9012]|uniref:hypothetical protein n=1 Tax=Massilia sp. CFBP9012 TaxID=3096531 RepID=UPI002A69E7C5|nr:hypothetical protein [Massilia sp. CFBP9012]MDY0977752.1 hypothetical protein [Massilia sp. CFBP9012]
MTSLRKLISGDDYHVESGGRSRTKTEFLQLPSRDAFEFRSYEIDNMEIQLLDNGRAAPDACLPRPRSKSARLLVKAA